MKIVKLKNGNYYVITDTMLDNGQYKQSECVLHCGVLKTREGCTYDPPAIVMPHNYITVHLGPRSYSKIVRLLPGQCLDIEEKRVKKQKPFEGEPCRKKSK